MSAALKIHADRNVCIGAGMCVMVAGVVFDQDEAGVVLLNDVDVPAEEEGRVRQAIGLCPSGALEVAEGH